MKYISLAVIFFASCAFGDQYVMTKSVFSNGGCTSSSSSYILKDAVGQSVTGQSASSSNIEQAGFFSYTQKNRVGAEEAVTSIPKVFSLSAPYPNPMANNVTIRYEVPRTSNVSIVVYNIAGSAVRTLVNGKQKAGFYTFQWNRIADTGGKITQGVYFIHMVSPEFSSTKKLIVVMK